MNWRITVAATAPIAVLAFLSHSAEASTESTEVVRPSDEWQFGAFVYGYYATIGTNATLPNGATSSVTIDAKDIFNNLKFGLLGSFEARKGSWGVYSDLMYMNVGKFDSQYHNLIIGRVGLPADVSSSTNLDIKSVVWTVAATYRAVTAQQATLDLLAGVRLFDEKVSVDWTLNGNVGPIPAPGRAGTVSAREDFTDGIVGLKGRIGIGPEQKWFLPYYGDIGTGNSKLTWQLMAGLGYGFKWGELIGGWRHVDYQFKSNSDISSSSFDGPMLGAAFHW